MLAFFQNRGLLGAVAVVVPVREGFTHIDLAMEELHVVGDTLTVPRNGRFILDDVLLAAELGRKTEKLAPISGFAPWHWHLEGTG